MSANAFGLADLSDQHAPGTVKTRYRGLFRFCGWLVDEEELEDNPMAKISPPVLKMSPVPVLTDDELSALLKACKGKTFNDRRDEAMIRLLLDCGARWPASSTFIRTASGTRSLTIF